MTEQGIRLAAPGPAAHSSVMGGSTCERRINCPGSYALEKQVPEPPTSEHAMRGTVLHAAMEILITALDFEADPKEYKKQYDQAMKDIVDQGLGFDPEYAITQELVDAKLTRAIDAFADLYDEYEFVDFFIEQNMSLAKHIPGAFGTADIVAIDKQGRLHIIDWKFGDGIVVSVENNFQLMFYAACALYDDDPDLIEATRNVTIIVLHIVQPLAGSERVVHSWETTVDTIEDFIDLAVKAYDTITGKTTVPLKPGSHCRWCRAKPTCSAHEAMAVNALSVQPQGMSSVKLAKAIGQADLLSQWIKDVYALAQRELEGGAQIPGYKLVKKRPTRKWIDEEKAEKILRDLKVKVGDMFSRKLKSPPQIQLTLPKKAYEAVSDLVELKSSGTTVVSDSDKREAVVDQFALLANALDGDSKPKQETAK